jgi:hypothetical protein
MEAYRVAAAGRPHSNGLAKEAEMTPEQVVDAVKTHIEICTVFIIAVQVVMGFVVLQASRRIARNEVELADLIRQAVSQIESDQAKK